MLPGFRFLFAAIVLSMSIIVFGLGAASLFRAAHEKLASNPWWHPSPETSFARQGEATEPVSAMLRIDPPPAEPKTADSNAAAVVITAPVAPVEPAARPPIPPEPEKTAALTPKDVSGPNTRSLTPGRGEVGKCRQWTITCQKTKPQKTKPPKRKLIEGEVKGLGTRSAADASPAIEAAPVPAGTPAPVAIADARKIATTRASFGAGERRRSGGLRARERRYRTGLSCGLKPKFGALGSSQPSPTNPPRSAPAKAASTRKRVQARRAARRRRIGAAARTSSAARDKNPGSRSVCTDTSFKLILINCPSGGAARVRAVRRACPNSDQRAISTARCRPSRAGTVPASAPAAEETPVAQVVTIGLVRSRPASFERAARS